MGELPIAEVEFNMADYVYGEYNPVTLYLKKSPENNMIDIDPNETYLSIGLKGTRANNSFIDKRSAINSLRSKGSRSALDTVSDNKTMNDRTNSISSMHTQEVERIKKENRLLQKELQRETTVKNTKINNLITDVENLKTDLNLAASDKMKLSHQEESLEK